MSRDHRPQPLPESAVFAPTWRRALAVLGLLVAVVALLYAPALHAPWYMDDYPLIVDNPLVHDLGSSLRGLFLPRGLALFSFALNYHWGGLDPFAYHLVNLGLHVGCGLLVYLLLQRLLSGERLFPVLGALLFVSHPLQTQAVTYLVQRMALLAAFFFLLAFWLFLRARADLARGVAFTAPGHLGCYLGALIAGLAAVLTKENTAVLPVVLCLIVSVCLPPVRDRRRLLLALLPFCCAPLLLAMVRLLLPLTNGETLAGISHATNLAHLPQLSVLHYLVTEFSVLWSYLRLLFLPYGQALDHDVPLAASLFAPPYLVAGSGLLLLALLAWRLRRSQPLLAAGIAWFFLTLAVESSFIPLDPLMEHRLYLPMFGFVLIVLGLLRLLPNPRSAAVLLAALVLLCFPLTWQRNRLWADPIAFHRDNLARTPANVRVLSDLANAYIDTDRLVEAEPLLRQALALNPDYQLARLNLLDLYLAQGRLAEGLALARQGLEQQPRSVKLLTGLGILYDRSGDPAKALHYLNQALAIDPSYALARSYREGMRAGQGR